MKSRRNKPDYSAHLQPQEQIRTTESFSSFFFSPSKLFFDGNSNLAVVLCSPICFYCFIMRPYSHPRHRHGHGHVAAEHKSLASWPCPKPTQSSTSRLEELGKCSTWYKAQTFAVDSSVNLRPHGFHVSPFFFFFFIIKVLKSNMSHMTTVDCTRSQPRTKNIAGNNSQGFYICLAACVCV